MVEINDTVLVTRNARDKVQVARYILEQHGNKYIIKRFTGQFGGKMITQPEKAIEAGKAKRTVFQQAELEYNALIKKATDKGYKKLSDLTKTKFDIINVDELNVIVPTIKTDSTGQIKPQLAKSSNDVAISTLDKEFFASRKLDGVRCLMRYDSETGEIKTSSRGGGDYDDSTVDIRSDEQLLEWFREHPNLILDGELYVHGWSLQKISGTCRLKTYDPDRCSHLQYWVYDIADSETNFNERLDTLTDMQIEFDDVNEKVKIVEHIYVNGWTKVKKLHDTFVSEGFEGLVLRKPDKKYAPGRRNSDWIKVKEYQDAEFEITGIEEGLRDEDMCFVLQTAEGKSFKAKPIGDRELKYEYLENWEDYVGKMATVKYFAMSQDNIPMQPVFKSIRDSE